MIEEKLLEIFAETDRELLARQILMEGFVHPQDACLDTELRMALTSVGLTKKIYTADSIATACREDHRQGLSENWRLDKIKAFDHFHLYFFIEFVSPFNARETGGCLFSAMPRCVTPALESLPPAGQKTIVEKIKNFIKSTVIEPGGDPANRATEKWEKAFSKYLLKDKFKPEYPGNQPVPLGMRLPALETFLHLAPENFAYHFTATAFYYCHTCKDNEISVARWHFFLDAENRLVSSIIPEALTETMDLQSFRQMERYNYSNILTPCLFAMTEISKEFHKTDDDHRTYLDIDGTNLIDRVRSLGIPE